MRATDITVMRLTTRSARALVAAALACAAVAGGLRPAAAADVATLRRQAQAVADEVSGLEHRLSALEGEKTRLAATIAASSRRIGILELAMRGTRARVSRARARVVDRAVEAYKQGPTSGLALILGAHDLSGALAAAEATGHAAQRDRRSLDDLHAALSGRRRAVDALDRRKRRLIAAETRLSAVGVHIQQILTRRRATLQRLDARVARLERQARAAALRAAAPSEAFARLLEGSGPAAGVPRAFVGTGVVFEGVASWYGPGFEGQATANGDTFDSDLYTAASRDLPFGTRLFVQHDGRGVVVVINDRGPFLKSRILDLSHAAARALGISGLGWITAEIVVPR